MSPFPYALAGLLLAAVPAAADVTPRQVWDDWLAAAAESDAEVTTGAVDDSGGRVVVTGLKMTAGTEADGRYQVTVDEITLAPNPDGTVGVTTSPEYPIVLSGTTEDGVVEETHLLVSHPGLTMTVSGEAGATAHSFTAPEIKVTLVELLRDGEAADLTGSAVFEDASGRYTPSGAEAGSSFAAANASLAFSGTDPDTDDTFDATVTSRELAGTNLFEVLGPDTAGVARGLAADATREGSFSTAATTFRFESDSEGESGVFSGITGPSAASLRLGGKALAYTGSTETLALSFSGSSLPLPEVTLDIVRSTIFFTTPLLADAEPQPYAFSMAMDGVAVDEGVWNMFDPAAILPRDPGTLTVDVSGDMVLTEDLGTTEMAEAAPGEIRTVSLNTARLALAGAEVAATGDLTMSEAGAGEAGAAGAIPGAIPGGVLPVGQIDVTLKGANALIDRLVQVGVVPEEQAMGARMMLSMFARPGTVEGEMVSTIRFAEGGGIFVNDQQVR